MSKSRYVRSWEDISAAFLTEILLKKNFQGKVLSITSESIGTGQVGENIRFNLEIEGDMPKSIVGKFPAIDETSRQTGIQLLNYQREVFFYNNLQSETAITTPNIFLCDIDPVTHDFIILMEDLAPGTPGDQIAGCGVSEAELALTQLAHLHGSMWEKTNLADDNIVSRGGKDQTPTGELYKALAPSFIERYRDALASTEKNAISDLGRSIHNYLADSDGAKTLIHIDYRLDNMMFGGPYPLAVVDWQSCAFGCPLNDVSYFMGTSLNPKIRLEEETRLLKHYFDTLKDYEVTIDWVSASDLYQRYAPAGLVMAVIASMIVGETQRGNEMFLAMAKRSTQMMLELDSLEVIS